MQKAIKHTLAFLLGLASLLAVILRLAQFFFYTDLKTGCIISSAKNTIAVFYAICFLIIILCGIISFKAFTASNPFGRLKSGKIKLICYLTGISFFYDFVHQCLNCYNYIDAGSDIQPNYIIPLIFIALTALLSTYYFYALGESLCSDRFDLQQIKYLHLAPAAWVFFRLLICIVTYADSLYAVEVIFQYAVLVFGIIFYILIIESIINSKFNFRLLAFFGLVYSIFSIIIAVPRIIAQLFLSELCNVTFSAVTYFFTGLFALVLSVNILKERQKNVS